VAWIFSSVVLVLVAIVPGVWKKVGIVLLAAVVALLVAG